MNSTIKHLKCCCGVSIFFLFLFSSCKKYVDLGPPKTQIASEIVFTDDATAISAIRGIYISMLTASDFASGDISSFTILGGMTADEFINHSTNTDRISFATNSLLPTGGVGSSIWTPCYKYIYYANSILEGLEKSTGVSSAVKKQLEGEAKFVRAFCYFYLVNLFGDVPLILTTDWRVNAVASRASQDQVYAQIVADLKDAQNLLANDFSFSAGERVRPNKWAATGLLARTYLYMGQWANAETESSSIIGNTQYSILANLNAVFLGNSQEAIWQLKPLDPTLLNTREARAFLNTVPPQWVSLTPDLINVFEVGDNRRTSWVRDTLSGATTYRNPFKYKVYLTGQPVTEYSMVLRLAEQYLIRAEARAKLNNIPGSQADINKIRNRAGLGNTPASDMPSLLLAIEKERRIELFSEWGHRWLDLKRTNRADAVLGLVKSPNWQSTDILFPIPQTELNSNPNLTQNLGY